MQSIICFFAFCLLFLIHPVGSASVFQLYRQREGRKILPKFVEGNFVVVSYLACCNICMRSNCRSVSWNAASGQCLLTSKNIPMAGMEGSYYTNEGEWVSFNHVTMAVFKAPSKNRISNVVDANAVCRDYKSIIATEKDLRKVSAAGHHLCKCAWYEDGIATIVQKFQIECYPYFGRRFVKCDLLSKAKGVWCKAY